MEVFHFETALAQSLYCCTFNGGDEPEMPACALKFSTTDVTLLVCPAGGETCLCQIDTMNDCSSMGCPARLQFNGLCGGAATLIACQTAAQWVVRRGCSVEVGVASVSLHFAPQLTFTLDFALADIITTTLSHLHHSDGLSGGVSSSRVRYVGAFS